MGRVCREWVHGPHTYVCRNCGTHLVSHDDLVSKAFQGRGGRAYLFNRCKNYTVGPKEDRKLITGLHTVCDIFCSYCESPLGWKYEAAYEESQKYKVGKFIIETINMCKHDRWTHENRLKLELDTSKEHQNSNNDGLDSSSEDSSHSGRQYAFRRRSRSRMESTFSLFMDRLSRLAAIEARRQEAESTENQDEEDEEED